MREKIGTESFCVKKGPQALRLYLRGKVISLDEANFAMLQKWEN